MTATFMRPRRDWALIIAGILMVICAFLLMVAPGLTLVMIASLSGVCLLVTGIFDIISYVRTHRYMQMPRWTLAYALLDIILGLVFLIHPIALAAFVPWMAGAGLIIFGIFEIAGALKGRKLGGSMWFLLITSGIIDILCAIMFFVNPLSFVIFIGLFLLMRGISLLVFGITAKKSMMF